MGETFASRVAGSILQAVDLPQLVTQTPEAYLALAHRLAAAPEELSRLKAHLERVRLTCPLFDSARYTKDLEDALLSTLA